MTTVAVPGCAGVVITGAGAVSPFGTGITALADGLRAGKTTFTPRGGRGRPTLAAPVGDPLGPGSFPPNTWRRLDRGSRMAVLAAREALRSAGFATAPGSGDTGPGGAAAGEGAAVPVAAGVVFGTMTAGCAPLESYLTTVFTEGPDAASPMIFPSTVPNAPAAQTSILLALRGANLTVCRMEASGLAAIITAVDLVRGGAAEVVVAGGVDELAPTVEAAWRRLRLVAGPRSPGFVPGEGAYVLVVESAGHARARGARAWAEVLATSAGQTGEAPHRWPSAQRRAVAVVRACLERSGVPPAGLACLFASANGAPALDRFESVVLREALGPTAGEAPVVCFKKFVGESGAASAGMAVAAALRVRDAGAIHRPSSGRDPAAMAGPVLVHALGSGGSCVSLVLGPPES